MVDERSHTRDARKAADRRMSCLACMPNIAGDLASAVAEQQRLSRRRRRRSGWETKVTSVPSGDRKGPVSENGMVRSLPLLPIEIYSDTG